MTDLFPTPSPQGRKVLDYLNRYGAITPMDAFLELGVARLSARVYDLKASGYAIKSTLIEVKTRSGTATVAEYTL